MRLALLLASATIMIFSVACASKPKKEVVEPKQPQKVVETKLLSPDIAYTCIVNEDKRRVRLDNKKLNENFNRCEIHYTKFGDKKQMAWAEATPSICTDIFRQIRSNIESKGFKCYSDAELQKLESKNKAKIKESKDNSTAKIKMPTKDIIEKAKALSKQKRSKQKRLRAVAKANELASSKDENSKAETKTSK